MVPEARGEQASGFCVIMAGGRGTRFWPLSRGGRPKHLLRLGSAHTLLRDTFERVVPLVGPERVLVVTGVEQVAGVRDELPELPSSHVLAEPVGRNTAPCAALGVGVAERLAGPGPVALLPADHWIPEADLFRRQLASAFAHAATAREPVTIGVPPATPETGYGYLEFDPAAPEEPVLRGRRFVEKPDRATAEAYLAGGRHFWNAGIFVWHSRDFASALTAHLPAVAAALAGPVAAHGGPAFEAALAEAYAGCPSVSIDVGIMEKLPAFAVLRAAFGWSDLGSWPAWGELAPQLAEGNSGLADLLAIASGGNVVHAPGKLVALVGVEDLIVVDTPEALLVCRAADAQRVREVTERLAAQGRRDLL